MNAIISNGNYTARVQLPLEHRHAFDFFSHFRLTKIFVWFIIKFNNLYVSHADRSKLKTWR